MDCVTDSSVWISLSAGGLVEEALQAPFTWLIPDVILEGELMEPSGAWLEQLGVRRCELSGSQVEKVAEMAARYLRPSRLDLFALVQAKGEGAVLLTDDGDLRAAAENEGLQVHGTLWLLDQLVAQGVVSKERAVEGLKQMKKAGSWLPKEEVGRRLRSWEG